jgi:nucleoside-diphosphate-sugar epimerase
MRAVIIGGTGHVGTYLVPRLVEAGYQVVCVSRSNRQPYQQHTAWKQVAFETLDRPQLESQGLFAEAILRLSPDVVIDMICFNKQSAKILVEALEGRVHHYLQCGSMWVHGHSVEVPTEEFQPRNPFGDYGINKAATEAYLLEKARKNGFPATVIHPGHIVGPGWNPVNPAGNLNIEVFKKLAAGEEVLLPNLGMETLHHVHADDVALGFMQALTLWNQSVGESFHIVSSKALTMRGYAEAMAAWFGQKPNLRFVPWDQWKQTVSAEDAHITWDHIAHSPNGSIEKARRLLQYQPRYTSLQAIQEALKWMIQNKSM